MSTAPAYRLRPYHLLAALPAVGMLGGVPFANRVNGLVVGLPVLLCWILAWVVATSGCMALLYLLDRRRQPDSDLDEPEVP